MTASTRVDDLTAAIMELPNHQLENLRAISGLARNLANARYKLAADERGGESGQSKDRTRKLIEDRSESLALAIDQMLNNLNQ